MTTQLVQCLGPWWLVLSSVLEQIGGNEKANQAISDASENFVGGYTFHKFNMILSGACTATTCLIILIVMIKHSLRFSNPNEQLKYVR
jgi:hypothetical protein